MDILEKNIDIISKIAKKFDIEKTKQKYIDNIELFEEVKKFIISKKLILYGGYAINLLLRDEDKFYEDYTLNDYDCYSINAQKDAIELVKILTAKGYKYIALKTALHENTFKVYADFEQILDITQVDKAFFDNIYKISLKEKRTEIYKYFTEKKLNIAPVLLLKRNLYFELARPYASIHRWVKLYPRLNLLNKTPMFRVKKQKYVLTTLPPKINAYCDILLKFIKTNNHILVGNFAYNIHKNIDNKSYNNNIESCITILSSKYEKTANEIELLLDSIIDKSLYSLKVNGYNDALGIMYNSKSIVITNNETNTHYKIIDIQNCENECFSFKTIKGYTVGTIYSILYIYYSLYTTLLSIDDTKKEYLDYIISHILDLELILKKNKDIREIISEECKGNIINLKEVKQNLWSAKRTIIKKKNIT
jgi:hypothetical protein